MRTDDLDLLLEAERALGAWAVGDIDFHVALQRACGGFSIEGHLTCALVYVDGSTLDVIGSADAERKPDLLRRIAMVASRDFITPTDPRWAGIVGRDSDAIPTVTPWIACEPVIQGPSMVQSVLVIIGGEDTPRDLSLSALIRLARWCGGVLAQERARITGSHLLQRAINLASGVVSNLDRVTADDSELTDASLETLQHARELATQLARQIHELDKLRPKR